MTLKLGFVIRFGLFCQLNIFLICEETNNKRIVLHSEIDLAKEIMNLKSDVANLTSENKALKGEVSTLQSKVAYLEQSDVASMQTRVGHVEQTVNNVLSEMRNLTKDMTGGVYIRWGRNICAGDAELVYRGYIAGKHYSSSGSGTDHLCLPSDPTWARYVDGGTNFRATLYGTEINIPEPNHIFEYAVNDQDLPCAVCKSKRMTTLMLPARKNCYQGWTIEYWGYLMSSAYDLASSYNHICLDSKPEFNPHGASNDNEHLIYPVEGRCGALPCPPYVNGRELACVVCSK